MKTKFVDIIDTYVKITISKQEFEVHNTKKKIDGNRYEPKVDLEDKLYSETYYSHQPRSVAMNETLAKIKTHEL
jgi:hypothetical protein